MKKLKNITVLGSVFLLIFLMLLAHDIETFAKKPVPEFRADYAVVLGALSRGEKPTPVFEKRIARGIALYQEKQVRQIIFTGKPGAPPQAIVAQNYALAQGVPAQAILIETQSMRTFENLLYAKALTPEKNPSFLIVSDPLHLRRAMKMAEDLKIHAYPAPVLDSAVLSYRSRTKFLIRESLAYAYYLILRRWV